MPLRDRCTALGQQAKATARRELLCVVMPAVDLPEIRCIGALVHDEAGRLLLIRRGREPGQGCWSLPGGRVEPGESDEQAVVREVLEETGLEVAVGAHVGAVRRPAPGGGVYEIHDYACRTTGGELRAGDDADDACWFDAAGFGTLPLVDGLAEALTSWDQLPR